MMQEQGLRGPRIHTAGPHIDGPGPTPYPNDSVIARDAEGFRKMLEAPWREMELLVEAGLTPMQAIQAATANGAAFLGRDGDLGTVEAGKLADLVVLTGNPLARISDIRTVERVLAGGAWVERAVEPPAPRNHRRHERGVLSRGCPSPERRSRRSTQSR